MIANSLVSMSQNTENQADLDLIVTTIVMEEDGRVSVYAENEVPKDLISVPLFNVQRPSTKKSPPRILLFSTKREDPNDSFRMQTADGVLHILGPDDTMLFMLAPGSWTTVQGPNVYVGGAPEIE